MSMLGPSLDDLLSMCGGRFTLKTTCMLMSELISRIQHVHQKQFIHRDIKPDNLLMGLRRSSATVHMIDYSLTKRYITKQNTHIRCKPKSRLVGTVRYASLNSHLGMELSRRDDLECAIYTVLQGLYGVLPW